MTTGVPLYLVSACASAEEFVAAFRRYTDRSGIFVPLAEPIAQGRRGRIALTLADGGVMIEGDCEIIQSSTKPSGLYGRVGMTLRFVDPDELGKTLLVELEKARLVMTPPKSSITPRPAEIPAAPRPTPPPISGRIDAANALAECVVIGDLTALREPLADPNKSGPGKFVIPTIPNMRGNSPTTPPALTARPKTPSTPPALTPRPKGSTVPPAAPPPTPPMAKSTTHGMPPMTKPPAETAAYQSVPGDRSGPRDEVTPPLLMRSGRPTEPGVANTAPPPRRANTPSTPPPPRSPTPYTPLPIVRLPATSDEPTDLTTVPQPPPIGEEQRKSSLGVSILTATAIETHDDDGDYVGPPPVPPPARSGGMRVSEIMAAIPSEDWTMTPDALVPTVLPAEAKVPPPPPEPEPPADNWTIKLDSEAPEGWSAPAAVERLPEPKVPPKGNRNVAVSSEKALVAIEWEEKPTGIGVPLVEIDPSLMEPPPPAVDDEPAQIVATPPIHDEVPTRPAPLPLPRPPVMPSALAGSQVTPPHGQGVLAGTGPNQAIPPGLGTLEILDLNSRPRADVTDGGTGFFQDSQSMPSYSTGLHAALDTRKRKRTLVIVMSSALVVALGVILVVMLGGGKKFKPPAGGGSAVANVVSADGSAVAIIPAPADAGSTTAPPAPPPIAKDAGTAAAATCPVEITTVPPGAEIAIDKTTVLGTTPNTFQIPCGVETKLYIRKKQYAGVIKPFTANAENTKLNIKLQAAVFQIKVTSMPPGATITVGGKLLGITPTTIKLPAFATSTITLSKDGFTPDTQKLAPRQNNVPYHVSLKRKTRLR